MSSDLELAYVFRSQLMLDGKIPYRDFAVNKPPMFAYMLYAMGLCFGAGQVQFRIFFSFVDSLIPIVIYLIGSHAWGRKFGIVAALSYAFCPINFLEIGLEGHYDCIPVLFVTISYLFLLKKRPFLSGMSLGLAFAFKIYPIVLLPFFLMWFKTIKHRAFFFCGFPIPMILSTIPIFIVYPSGLFDYLSYQTVEWQAWGLISGPFVRFFGKTVFGIHIPMAVLFIFLFFILLLFYSTSIKKKPFTIWVKLIIFILIFMEILWVLQFFDHWLHKVVIALLLVISIVFLIIIYFPVSRYIDPLLAFSIKQEDELLIQSVIAILLLIFGSIQAHSWYFLWVLPFVFLIRTEKMKWFFLILLLTIHPSENLANRHEFRGMI
jgi:hypothetical protein